MITSRGCLELQSRTPKWAAGVLLQTAMLLQLATGAAAAWGGSAGLVVRREVMAAAAAPIGNTGLVVRAAAIRSAVMVLGQAARCTPDRW